MIILPKISIWNIWPPFLGFHGKQLQSIIRYFGFFVALSGFYFDGIFFLQQKIRMSISKIRNLNRINQSNLYLHLLIFALKAIVKLISRPQMCFSSYSSFLNIPILKQQILKILLANWTQASDRSNHGRFQKHIIFLHLLSQEKQLNGKIIGETTKVATSKKKLHQL